VTARSVWAAPSLLAHKCQSQKVKELVWKLAEDPKLKKLV
jgi:hypothetical protein